MKKRTIGIAAVLFIISGILFATDLNLFAEHEIRFTGTAKIEGIIKDKNSGSVLRGVTVQIKGSEFTAVSDSNGYYSIEKLEAGSYTLKYVFAGYDELEDKVSVTDGEIKKHDVLMQMTQMVIEELNVAADKAEMKRDSKMFSPSYNSGTLQGNKSTAEGYYNEDVELYDPSFNTEAYNTIIENGYKKVIGDPLSTFSIDVDNASYANIRRFISYGQTPPKDAVRIEEMLNYFDYDYAKPGSNDPFAINMEISDCPWNAKSKIVMIGLQGKDVDLTKADPGNLVFLIDVSGSMQDANKLGLVKSSLNFLVDNLQSTDKVALVVYAGAAGVVLPSTPVSQKQKIKDALNALEAGGSTAGGEGIKLAYKIANENLIKGGNNRVIICTDGDFNVGASSDAEMTRLIEEERKTGVFLTVCGFGMGNYKDSKMEQIADNGNGNYFYIDGDKEAKKVFGADLRGTLFTIAKDVKIQVEFNPAKVESYRLIGYENRLLNKEDFDNDQKDAGELGAGHKVTAMYEVILTANNNYEPGTIKNDRDSEGNKLKYQTTEVKPDAYFSDDILTIKLRYKEPGGDVSKLIERSIRDTQVPLAESSDNFRFACAVTEFGMLLRDSEYKGSSTIESAVKLAANAKGKDASGYRSDFISMMQTYIGFAQK